MIALLIAALLQSASQDSVLPRVQRGITVQPETVTVGQHFRVAVRVRAPRGAAIAFPPEPDTTGPIDAVDPRLLRATSDTGATDQTAVYRLAAWDTGSLALPLTDAVVTLGGVQRTVPLADAQVYVRSVLPPDTSKHVPKPPRGIIAAPTAWWPWLVALLAVAALLALFTWWWWRRRRTGAGSAAEPDNALARAEREFMRIDALGLLEAGERGRFVALNIEVLRDYLAVRFDDAPRSLTSTELLIALRGRPVVPLGRLGPLLSEADLIKFAGRPVTSERARQLASETRAIVRDIDGRMSDATAQARAA